MMTAAPGLVRRRLFVGILITCVSLGGGAILADFTEPAVTPVANSALVFARSGVWSVQRPDSAGVPRQYYARLGKAFYNPVYIAIIGLDDWQLLSGRSDYQYFISQYSNLIRSQSRPEANRRFLAVANWLRDNLEHRVDPSGRSFGVWTYGFPWSLYSLDSGWVSGMAQGLGLQVLGRAWELTRDSSYLSAARQAMNALAVRVEDGGVTYKDGRNAWWYEEYAAPHATKSRVLNGMEHAILSLYDFRTISGDILADSLIAKGMASLTAHIDDFDLGWWTKYDLVGTIANYKYQNVNVALTRELAEVSADEHLRSTAQRWASQDSPFFVREFIRQSPNIVDFVILMLNSLIVALALAVAVVSYLKWTVLVTYRSPRSAAHS